MRVYTSGFNKKKKIVNNGYKLGNFESMSSSGEQTT
jgi:hypothetical protein